MGSKLFDPSQISDAIVKMRHMVDPADSFSFWDDLYIQAVLTNIYDTEGVGGLGVGVGGTWRQTSGAVAGNRARLNMDDTQIPMIGGRPMVIWVRAATIQTVQNVTFLGIFSALPTAAVPPVEPTHGVYFKRADAAGVANWFAVCRTASVSTQADTGIVGDTIMHDFKIIYTPTQVLFFIDGVQKAAISTNIPQVQSMFLGGVNVTQEAVAKGTEYDTFAFYNKRATTPDG